MPRMMDAKRRDGQQEPEGGVGDWRQGRGTIMRYGWIGGGAVTAWR
ncbi:hypothetical protein OCGS_1901 [Oceaniovalibus guishaninsula JLT2003]|uniref:Uncharacterized protein n=1 Tax=Oceaniovalibus guishaninsula JLT2003 TaxID=1231392 RepID=K2I4S0_9RHOB|nr:hypothetical protein OCGS_1901 [Oceaniovalibus guishaninsula JLT2003]